MPPPVDGKRNDVARNGVKHPTMPSEAASPSQQQGTDYSTLSSMYCQEHSVTPNTEHRAAHIVVLRIAGQITTPKQARYQGGVEASSRVRPKQTVCKTAGFKWSGASRAKHVMVAPSVNRKTHTCKDKRHHHRHHHEVHEFPDMCCRNVKVHVGIPEDGGENTSPNCTS